MGFLSSIVNDSQPRIPFPVRPAPGAVPVTTDNGLTEQNANGPAVVSTGELNSFKPPIVHPLSADIRPPAPQPSIADPLPEAPALEPSAPTRLPPVRKTADRGVAPVTVAMDDEPTLVAFPEPLEETTRAGDTSLPEPPVVMGKRSAKTSLSAEEPSRIGKLPSDPEQPLPIRRDELGRETLEEGVLPSPAARGRPDVVEHPATCAPQIEPGAVEQTAEPPSVPAAEEPQPVSPKVVPAMAAELPAEPPPMVHGRWGPPQRISPAEENAEPTVQIGRVEILVDAPEPVRQSVAPPPKSDNIASRHYLWRL